MGVLLGKRKETIEFFLDPGLSLVNVVVDRSEVLLGVLLTMHSLLFAGVILELKVWLLLI